MILTGNKQQLTKAELEMATAPVGRLFARFAVPGVVGLLFIGLQTIIDGIILGNYVGANALASVSLVLPCYSLISAIAIVLGVGCQTLVSIGLGRGDIRGANDALRSAFVSLTAFSVAVSLVLWIFAPGIARLLGANDVLLEGSVSYIRALAPFFPMIAVMFLGDYTLKALGHPIYSMIVMSGTVLVNIGLDLVFVPVLDMGISGAALSTGIAFTAGAAAVLPVLLRQRRVSFLSGRFSGRLVWRMFYNGSSEGISEFSAGVCTLLFNVALMKYLGESGVAAFSAINYVFFIGITVLLGVSDGIIPIISYNYGAGLSKRIGRVLRLAVRTNLLIGIGLFLVLTLCGPQLISLFFRSDAPDVIRIAAQGAGVYAFAFFLNGLNILASSYFTAMENARLSVVVSLLRGLVFVAAGILVYPQLLGIEGIWLAVPVAELCTLAVSVLLIRRSLRRDLGMPIKAIWQR